MNLSKFKIGMKDIVIIIVMLLIVAAIVWYYFSKKYRKIVENWQVLADKYNLMPVFPKRIWNWAWGDRPHALGKMGEIPTRFDTVHLGSTDALTYSRARFTLLNKREETLQIYKADVLSAIGEKLGVKDTHLGNPAFDKHFVIHGDNESFTQAVLTPNIQAMLLERSPKKARYWLDKGKLNFEISWNDLRNEQELSDYMQALEISYALAQELENQ